MSICLYSKSKCIKMKRVGIYETKGTISKSEYWGYGIERFD